MIAEPVRVPPQAMREPEDLDPQREPSLAAVGRLQAQLGVQVPSAEGYGPTSHLSEDLLMRGYGLVASRPVRPEPNAQVGGVSFERSDLDEAFLEERRRADLDVLGLQHAVGVGQQERHQEDLLRLERERAGLGLRDHAFDRTLAEDSFLRPVVGHPTSLVQRP